MGKKRRTKKQKQNAKHSISYTWEPSSQKNPRHVSVKGQFKNSHKVGIKKNKELKKADKLAKDAPYIQIKRDILKSILIASLIICLELVLYFG